MDRKNPGFGAPMNQDLPVAAKEVEEQVFHARSPFSFADGMPADRIKIIHSTILSALDPQKKYSIITMVTGEDQNFAIKFMDWINSRSSLFVPNNVMGLLPIDWQTRVANFLYHGHYDQALELSWNASAAVGFGMREYVNFVKDPILWPKFVFDNAKKTLEDWMFKNNAEKRTMRKLAEMEAKRPRSDDVSQVDAMTAPAHQNNLGAPGVHNISSGSMPPPPGFLPNNRYGNAMPSRSEWNTFGNVNGNSNSAPRLGHTTNAQNSAETLVQREGVDYTHEKNSYEGQQTPGRVYRQQSHGDNPTSSAYSNHQSSRTFGTYCQNLENKERADKSKLVDYSEDNSGSGGDGTAVSCFNFDSSHNRVETVSARFGSQREPQTPPKAEQNATGYANKDDDISYGMQSTYQHDYCHGSHQNSLHETLTRPESSFSSSTPAPASVTTTAKCTIFTNKNEVLDKIDEELMKPYERRYQEQSHENWEKFDEETATPFEEKPWNLDAPIEKSREYSEPTLAVKPAPSRSRSNSRARQASASRKPRSSSRNLKPSLPVPKKRSESPVSETVPPASAASKRSKSPSNRPLTSTPAPRKRSESPKFKATRQPKRKALNILLLGETGVGKTTFINGLVNYLKFETLEGALTEEPTILIDTSFTITGMDNKTRTISAKANTGVDKKTIKLNERLGQNGSSSTQDPVDHIFEWMDEGKKKLVRLIDTPGINDTRGTEQDAKNFEKILKHIAELGELHAICIVMKPNESKFTMGFRYCLDELLVKLHKSATKNILFCFTNTRSTLYRPGDSIATLHKYLKNLYRETGIRIEDRRSNIFCYDNESFRYLCLLRQIRTARKDDMITTYAESWTHNVKESIMMLKRVQGLTAHVVEDTLTINNARKVVTALARPLAEMARNHVVNMNVIEDQMKEVENLQRTGQSLDESRFHDQIVMVPVKLEKPRTVCTSLTCVELVKINDYETKVFPKIICHDACYLTSVPEQSLNNQSLANCVAFMGGNGTCRECGCHWNKHMHITYQLEKRMEKLMDKEASRKLELCSSEWKKAQMVLKELKEKLAHLKHEHDVIRESCPEFAVFLAVNALKKACDPFADYLTFLVQKECEMWSHEASNGDLIATLLDIQEDYQKRVDFIKTEIEAGRRCALSTAELNKKIINLGQLKESGPVISKLMEEHLHTCSTVEASAPPEESVKDTKKNGDHLCLKMKGMNIASDDKEKAKNDSRSASTDQQMTQRGWRKNQ